MENENKKNNGIGTIHIVLTTYCNVGCKGCYQEDKEDLQNKSELIFNNIIKNRIIYLYEKYRNEHKKIKVLFFGGEPLLKSNTMIEIIEFLYENNLIPDSIAFPTSGGINQSLIKQGLKVIDKMNDRFPDAGITFSLSYDGNINLETRNIKREDILNSIYKIKEKEKEINKRILPAMVMNLIPQRITKDYFIKNHIDITETFDGLPIFRIPHILDKDTNLDQNIVYEALLDYLEWLPKDINYYPKLIVDYLDRILSKEPEKLKDFNWCQAGVNHFALSNIKGKEFVACEYLDQDADILYNKMMKECNNCSIQNYCSKPCLKTIEVSKDLDQFKKHCTLRKLIFKAIKTFFKDNYKNINLKKENI